MWTVKTSIFNVTIYYYPKKWCKGLRYGLETSGGSKTWGSNCGGRKGKGPGGGRGGGRKGAETLEIKGVKRQQSFTQISPLAQSKRNASLQLYSVTHCGHSWLGKRRKSLPQNRSSHDNVSRRQSKHSQCCIGLLAIARRTSIPGMSPMSKSKSVQSEMKH